MTKDYVLRELQEHPDRFVSGAFLADRLQITRAAVWKAVEQLRREGYPIESVPRRGHRLSAGYDVLSEAGIRRYLSRSDLQIRVYSTITSTNTVLKQMALEDAPSGLALVAGEQTAGRGRLGRSFYSPSGSGLYLSLLLRPDLSAAEATSLTACAAVSTAEALESLSDVKAGIKWVNDILIDGKKVCGILTEAGLDCETGRMSYVIIGIGVNTKVPSGDFPEELREIAGSAFGEKTIPDLRNRLAALILEKLMKYSVDPSDSAVFEEYRRRSLAPGKHIRILSPGREPVPAEALDLERDYSLLVRREDGSTELLRSGEISIRF